MREWHFSFSDALETPLSRAWICLSLSCERNGLVPAGESYGSREFQYYYDQL